MFIDDDIRIVETRLLSFTEQVNREIINETRDIEYECLCGEDTTTKLDILSSTMIDYVNFFSKLNSAVQYGEPAVVKKVIYEPDLITKTLLVVRI